MFQDLSPAYSISKEKMHWSSYQSPTGGYLSSLSRRSVRLSVCPHLSFTHFFFFMLLKNNMKLVEQLQNVKQQIRFILLLRLVDILSRKIFFYILFFNDRVRCVLNKRYPYVFSNNIVTCIVTFIISNKQSSVKQCQLLCCIFYRQFLNGFSILFAACVIIIFHNVILCEIKISDLWWNI